MIYFLVGHRGSGKTSLLKRIDAYFSESAQKVFVADLDSLIELQARAKVSEIFEFQGEPAFRKLELQVFNAFVDLHLSSESQVFLSVGAGFALENLPRKAQCQVIWIRRPTDSLGRIFLDRPRLNSQTSALGEYLERFQSREEAYAACADWVWSVLEGWNHPNEFEKNYFVSNFYLDSERSRNFNFEIPATFTVLPNSLKGLPQRLNWKGLRFEIRDDLLSQEQQKLVFELVSKDRILYSFRSSSVTLKQVESVINLGVAWDWQCEAGDLRLIHPSAAPTWISLHERRIHNDITESVSECIHRLSALRDQINSKACLKLAIEIKDFSELQVGHRWMLEDPKHRSFLPRTPSTHSVPIQSKWNWYRLWTLPTSSLSFVREGYGSSNDQPVLAQVLQRQILPQANWFAAVLGDPVVQSRTPAEQFKFFRERGMPVFAIPLAREEWPSGPASADSLTVLREMGLRAAAVTSPLKLLAGASDSSSVNTSVNTLFWSDVDGRWISTNTDELGLKKLFEGYEQETRIAVWGGGGTIDGIRRQLPRARLFSARTGEAKDFCGSDLVDPQVVIWAAGSLSAANPPENWQPLEVLDLSYAENSTGREFARRVGAKYVSGLSMFFEQALGQREFWKKSILENGNGR